MAQAHGDRLTAVDASFLAQESQNAHMHIGAVMVFEGPPPAFDDFADHVRGRLHLVPRYRQKLAVPPLETGRPLWVDDPTFNLEYHLRHTALPEPGSEDQLRALAARIHSQRLDRDKPLWELWLVQGLEDGRFALISKTHHAVVDGIAGVDLATVLFDLEPVPAPMPHEGEPWVPQPEPSAVALAARGVRGLVELPFSLAGRALRAAAKPGHVAARRARGGRGRRRGGVGGPEPGARHAAQRADRPAPAAGADPQRAGRVQARQGRLRRHGQRRRADRRGRRPAQVAPVARRAHRGARAARARAGVDPRRRRARATVATGSRSCAARCRSTSRTRSRACRSSAQAMDGLKESKQAVGAEVLTSVQNLAPPTVLAQASRINFSTRLFNLLVTNVPGPQFPLYALGRKLDDLFPVAFLPRDHALAVAIMSYNGGMDFGLLGDFDAMPDLDALGEMFEEARDELVERGPRSELQRRASTRGRTSRPRTSSRASKGA